MTVRWIHTGAVVFGLFLLAGCYERVTQDPWARYRELEQDSVRREAELMSGQIPSARPEGTGNPLDLQNYSGYYTLQIGYYNDRAGSGYRKKAEQRVKDLRRHNLEAFYYHGPFMSIVSVGLFTDDDFRWDKGYSEYGPRVTELQERFPHNVANEGVKIKSEDDDLPPEPSFLVRAP